MDTMTLVVAGLAAAAIIVIAVGVAMSGSGSGMSERLQRYASTPKPEAAKGGGQGPISDLIAQSQTLAQLNKVVEQRDFGANLARELARADLRLKPSEFLVIWGASIVGVPLIMAVLLGRPSDARQPAVPADRRVRRLLHPALLAEPPQGQPSQGVQQAAADTITLLANALRAGSSFLQAIEMVVRESQPPISTEFGRVIREVNLGLPFEQALENMVRRVRSEDLELMTTAITIQHQVGGNLAEILDSIAFTIRERVRIKGEINTLTAQQRMSGYVVGFLPIGLAGFLFIAAPGSLSPCSTSRASLIGLPAGVILLAIGGFMMFIGFMLIRRIVDIEV